MEQEVLRQQPKSGPEGSDWQFSRVHTVPQDPCERADERGSSPRLGAIEHHSKRVGLSGACYFRNNNEIQRTNASFAFFRFVFIIYLIYVYTYIELTSCF